MKLDAETVIFKNWKAVVGFLVAFLGGIQIGFLEDGLSAAEFTGALIAGLLTLGGVYTVPNKGMADTQKVVDAVKANVADDVAQVIDEAVKSADTGVLKDVN